MSGFPLVSRRGADGEVIPFCLPQEPARLFAGRAARLRALAPAHAAGDFLAALGRLAEAQSRACEAIPAVPMGSAGAWPPVPLDAATWRRDEAWGGALDVILAEMAKGTSLPELAQAALARLARTTPSELETIADALLSGEAGRVDPAAAPFVGAALQVYWTTLASRLPAGKLGGGEHGCPACGSPPVAGLVLGDGLRYLTCSLCAAEWHLTRVVCAACRSTEGISYFGVEGDPGAVKAEACEKCRTYLKLFYLEKSPGAEPLADDLATLPLDLLMAEEGYARGGVNFFLLSGANP